MKGKSHFAWWYIGATAFVGVFLLPIWRPAWFAEPLTSGIGVQWTIRIALLLICPTVAWFALHGEQLSRRERFGVWYLALAATAVSEVLHYWIVDRGHYFPESMFSNNTTWQVFMHGPILDLSPGALPHSYRFMPDAIVKVFTWLCGDFVWARIAYRVAFNALLYVAIFRYARTYASVVFSGVAVLLVTALYPITILKYAGQFVDPMSHFTIVACLLCLARRYEPAFGPLLFASVFAKESVILVAACRLFQGRNVKRALVASVFYGVVALVIILAIRHVALRGNLEYRAISGVTFKHITENLGWYREWILMYVAIAASLVPGAILGWKAMDRGFRWSFWVILAGTLLSSTVFSWLSEIRNMMPAFVMLAVVNAAWLHRKFGAPTDPNPAPAEPRPAAEWGRS